MRLIIKLMKRWVLLFGICLIYQFGYSQTLGIKSNVLYDATSTINLGVEFALSEKWTLDISGNYNPWAFPQQKINSSKVVISEHDAIMKHWMVQPEIRRWFCESFNGHFVGLHAHGGQFNVGGLTFLPKEWGENGIQRKRFQGWLAGGGVSYGYHWILSSRLSLEFSLGVGYTFMKYEKYNHYADNEPTQLDRNHYKMRYIGPTKAGISVIVMLY